jgi:hypothetical protein
MQAPNSAAITLLMKTHTCTLLCFGSGFSVSLKVSCVANMVLIVAMLGNGRAVKM